jgi:glycogen debranching enzyme
MSRCEYFVDDKPLEVSALSNIDQHTWLGYYFRRVPGAPPREADTGSGQVPLATEETLELRVYRRVGEGLHEDLHLTNFSRHATHFTLKVSIEADFADYVETGGNRQQRGHISTRWETTPPSLTLHYSATSQAHDAESPASFGSCLRLNINRSPVSPSWKKDSLLFDMQMAPGAQADICLTCVPIFDGKPLGVPESCNGGGESIEYEARTKHFLERATGIENGRPRRTSERVIAALEQARADLAALRLFDLDHDEDAWVPAAGLPIYVALFGRDTLTAAWQSAILGPEILKGTLLELSRWVGHEDNPWRDEQPGKLLHEAHTGPTSILNVNPRSRYYGSITTSGFYPVVLAELWHWTGNRALVERLLPTALGGLEWLDEYGDVNRDGLYEYLSRSPAGTKHQAWKDSRDAMVDEDGSEIEPPIATCEEQAFVYIAKLHLAEVCWWLDRKELARRLRHEAHDLKERFNDRFWIESEGFFAMGLGPDGRQIRSISSNPGHCLAAGIVDEHHVAATADRLMSPELFSGWGIRTLSAEHRAYNPYSYHRGSVWPVEQGSFAMGFLRYGLHDHLARLARGVFDAAAIFEHTRLPELFGGQTRSVDQPFPALYPQANSPQAWSASALFMLVQGMAGLYPYAPLRALLLDPHLPDWLPTLTLRGVRVGDARVDLRFERSEDGRTSYQVLDKRGTLHIVRQPSPWSLTATLGERMRDALESVLPH